MKRVIISLAFLFLCSFSFSQSTFYTYLLRSGKWNTYNKKWDLEDNKISIQIEFFTTHIRIHDKAQSDYTITTNGEEETSKEWKSTKWDAYDEQGRKVVANLTKYNDGVLAFMIMYDDYLFIYYIEKSNTGLSPLR
jgi:hypothetical protein